MKIEELSRKNAWLTYEIQNVLSEIILTYIMDVDFISKDGVACHNTKDYVVHIPKILHLLHFLVIWKCVSNFRIMARCPIQYVCI